MQQPPLSRAPLSTSCSSAAGSGSAASDRSAAAMRFVRCFEHRFEVVLPLLQALRAGLPSARAQRPPKSPARTASRDFSLRRQRRGARLLGRARGTAPSAQEPHPARRRACATAVSWPGSSAASAASRLTRSSRSAAAAPAPSATKPSQRRKRPSRVTSRCPTASDCPSSSSTTATCASRRSSSVGAVT